MRILVFGGTGMLGHKLVQVLGRRFDMWAAVRRPFAEVERFGIFDGARCIDQVDVMDEGSVRRAIDAAKPDAVINAVGIIKQRPEAKDEVTTLGINTLFPLKLAALGETRGFRLITISTDCVFSGSKGDYSEADEPDARDLYGLSKWLGEVSAGNCLTLRTSIIGRELESTASLVEWFLSKRNGEVEGWTRAIYSGFPSIEMAKIIGDVIEFHPDLRGLYHVSSEPVSKFDLLELVNDAYDANIKITPSEKVTIDRSLDSTRFRDAAGYQPPAWPDMVSAMADDPTPYDMFHV